MGVRKFWYFTLLQDDNVVVVLGFYVPPKAKVIRRRDLGLKSHPKNYFRVRNYLADIMV